jgi:hypothetical protein
LIAAVTAEGDVYLKSRICDIVGELAGYVLEPADWPEIIPYTYSIIQSDDPLNREVGLSLLGMVAGNVVELMETHKNFAAGAAIFERSLRDQSGDGRVMLAAIRALGAIVPQISESNLEVFQALAPTLIHGLHALSKAAMEGHLPPSAPSTYIEIVIEIVEDSPHFFDPHMHMAYENLVVVVEAQSVPAQLRHICLELIVTMCEQSPKKTRKTVDPANASGKHWFASRAFPVCVKMLVDVPADPTWEQAEQPEEAAEGAAECDVGEVALDRMCNALGLGSTWPVVTAEVSSLLRAGAEGPAAARWACVHAALRLLGNYLEVTKTISDKAQLLQHRTDVVNTVMSFVSDSNARVRGACFYALSQYFTMHGMNISAEQVDRVLPVVLQGMSKASNPPPRVRRYVILCLGSLIDKAPASSIEQRSGVVLEAVCQALRDGPSFIQEIAIGVVISLSETVRGPIMAGYYDALVPVLKEMMAQAFAEKNEILWAQGIECCAMVGESAGKDKFYNDAIEMMTFLSSLQTDTFGGNEAEVKKYLLKAWIRIARCLGAEFVPFLPIIMGHLLEAITQDVTAKDIENPEDADDRSDIEVVESETGWVAVRTAAVEEQASACQLVVLVAERLQEHFYPYVQDAVSVMSALLDSTHEDVRSYCMVAMPEFLRATAKATLPDRGPTQQLAEYIFGRVLNTVTTENNEELVMTGLQSVKNCLRYCCTDWVALRSGDIGNANFSGGYMGSYEPPAPTPSVSIPFMTEGQMKAVTDTCTIVVRDCLQKRAMLRAEAQLSGGADENDAADECMFLQESMEMLYNVAEVIGEIFRTHGSLYFDLYMTSWHPVVAAMTGAHCLKEDRQFAFFVISDVIEFGLSDKHASEFLTSVIPLVCETVGKTPEANVRQTTAYVIQIAADNFPSQFAPFAMTALMALAASVGMGEDPPEEMRGNATDNAVAAIGVILERMESVGVTLGYAAMWSQWIAYLPLQHDTEEGAKVITQLCRLLTGRHSHMVSSEHTMDACITALLLAVAKDLCGDGTVQDVVGCLHHIQQHYAPSEAALIDAVISQKFSPELKEKLQKVLIKVDNSISTSPLGSAPIHDLLMGHTNRR